MATAEIAPPVGCVACFNAITPQDLDDLLAPHIDGVIPRQSMARMILGLRRIGAQTTAMSYLTRALGGDPYTPPPQVVATPKGVLIGAGATYEDTLPFGGPGQCVVRVDGQLERPYWLNPSP